MAQQGCALLRIFANQHAECAKRVGYQPAFNFADPFSFTANENSLPKQLTLKSPWGLILLLALFP